MNGEGYQPDDYRNLKYQLGDFRVAYSKARLAIEASSKEGFTEGVAWAKLFAELMSLFENNGLPHRVSKGKLRAKTAQPPSPFVRFARKLQEMFPAAAYQRHLHSDDALATALTKARRLIRRR